MPFVGFSGRSRYMSAEENKAIIRRAAQAASSGDFDAFDELMALDVAAEVQRGYSRDPPGLPRLPRRR